MLVSDQKGLLIVNLILVFAIFTSSDWYPFYSAVMSFFSYLKSEKNEVKVDYANPLINQQNTIPQAKELENGKSFGKQIKTIKATDFPDSLVNGISNSLTDFAAVPLGQPIELEWTTPLEIRKLLVHLWDFDGRTYRFTVEARSANTWHMLADFSKVDKSGKVEIPVPETYPTMDAVKLIGYTNSNSLINPQNKIFHVKELEWVK